MSSHSRIIEWTAMIRTHLPALSKPQAMVLALWGWILILVALLDHEPLPLGVFLPEPWPGVSSIDGAGVGHDSGILHDVAG